VTICGVRQHVPLFGVEVGGRWMLDRAAAFGARPTQGGCLMGVWVPRKAGIVFATELESGADLRQPPARRGTAERIVVAVFGARELLGAHGHRREWSEAATRVGVG
jgi:hypothetical protein